MNADQGVVTIVRAYGAAHPDTYGGLRNNNGQVVASFTSDLEGHLERLRRLVSDPGSVDVEATAYSGAYLDGIRVALRDRFAGDPRRPWQTMGPGHIALGAPFEDIAARLHAEYGDALDVWVGAQPYPPSRIAARGPRPVPPSTIELPKLQTDISLDDDTVRSGDEFQGAVRFTNRGKRRIVFMGGQPLIGAIRRPSEEWLAGVRTGAITGRGAMVNLAPGESYELRMLGGTASCLTDHPYLLPPDVYEVLVEIPLSLREEDGTTAAIDDPTPPGMQTVLVRFGPALAVTPRT